MTLKNQHSECCEAEEQHHKGIGEHDHNHGTSGNEGWLGQWPLLCSLLVIVVMMVLEYGFRITFSSAVQLAIYLPSYLLAGYNVLRLAYRKALRLDFFNEFFLMSVATIGAFAIGSYSEGVAVMVFYSIGEWFQDSAVTKAKRSIKALLDIRPDMVNVIRNGNIQMVKPGDVSLDEVIEVKVGEKVALDGILMSDRAVFNTAALTGESRPDNKAKGEQVFAGMVNLDKVSQIKVQALFKDSKLSKILEMVQDATARKSQTQLFISRFAKVYTPIVFLLAVLVVVLPYLFVAGYVFSEWLYRGLVFLVISCPCALVVSIPLGYFGGIGLASKNGILFKGGNFLDVMTKIDTVVMDKTGTLTKGVFKVQEVSTVFMDEKELLLLAAAVESKSTHPIAIAVANHVGSIPTDIIKEVTELTGYGLSGVINGKTVLVGNVKLLKKFNIEYDAEIDQEVDTIVAIAVDGKYAGYITISDEIKEDAKQTVTALNALRIQTIMLSGDRQSVVDKVASILGINKAFGDLLPDQKVEKLEALKQRGARLAFVGDGLNDAPVIALADAGIAMGGLGSDAAIETADIVIQNDQPSKIVTAIQIGKLTRNIVWQNISLAMIVKVGVLILGAGGLATLWEAVIADVGVALLAILNAIRIQHIKFRI